MRIHSEAVCPTSVMGSSIYTFYGILYTVMRMYNNMFIGAAYQLNGCVRCSCTAVVMRCGMLAVLEVR